MEGFQSKMKLPLFGKFSGLNREFHPKLHPYFWNSRILEYFKIAGMFNRGSFITLLEAACRQETESIPRRVTRLKDSRGYSIPKFWTNFKQGVSLLPKIYPYFWNS